jgi:hypothetical protein
MLTPVVRSVARRRGLVVAPARIGGTRGRPRSMVGWRSHWLRCRRARRSPDLGLPITEHSFRLAILGAALRSSAESGLVDDARGSARRQADPAARRIDNSDRRGGRLSAHTLQPGQRPRHPVLVRGHYQRPQPSRQHGWRHGRGVGRGRGGLRDTLRHRGRSECWLRYRSPSRAARRASSSSTSSLPPSSWGIAAASFSVPRSRGSARRTRSRTARAGRWRS